MKKILIVLVTFGLLFFTNYTFADTGATATSATESTSSSSAIDNSTTAQQNLQSIDSHDTYEATDRAFPNAGPVPIPGQPGWFTTPTPDGEFIQMKNILEFGRVFSEGALENMAKGGSTRVTYAEVNKAKRVSKRDKNDRRILVVIDPVRIKEIKENGTHVAYVNGAAKNGTTNSVQLVGAMALKAIHNGANVIVFKAEGAHRKVEAFGWGIGFAYAKATDSSLATGGTGISGGSAGPEDRPWLQGNAFVSKTVQEMLDKL